MPVSPASLPRMSPAEYLEYEHSQEIRHELVDGYLYAMTGASERHERIATNLVIAIGAHLRGTPCRVYKSDLKLVVGDDFYYPDVFVACGPTDPQAYSRNDPVVVIEVLSPPTQRHDRGDKRLAYASLPTLKEYVLVWQDRSRVEVRTAADDALRVLESAEETLRLDSIDFSMTLEELYG